MFKNFIYYLSNTDPIIIRQFKPSLRVVSHIIGVSILLAGLISTVSVGYFLASVFHVHPYQVWIIFFGSILYFFTIVTLDKALFISQSIKAVLIRAAFIIIIVSITSVPFKLSLLDSRIKTEIQNMAKEKRRPDFEKLSNLEAGYKIKAHGLNKQISNLKKEQMEMQRLRDAEDNGLKLKQESTGIQGKGQAWNSYNNQVLILDKNIKRLENKLDGMEEKHVGELSRAEGLIERTAPEVDESFISRYIAFKQVIKRANIDEKVAYNEFNIAIYLFFMLLELSPVILKLLLGKSNVYAHMAEQDTAFHREVLERKQAYVTALLNQKAPKQVSSDTDLDEGIDNIKDILNKDSKFF